MRLVTLFLFICFTVIFPAQVTADGPTSTKITQVTPDSKDKRIERQTDKKNTQEQSVTDTNRIHDLTNIISFHIALISLFVPLSVEMVSRISERYGSGAISKYYKKEPLLQIIFYFSIFNLFFSVCVMYFSNTSDVLHGISLGVFLITLVLMIFYLRVLYKYLTDIDWIIGKFLKDVKQIIS